MARRVAHAFLLLAIISPAALPSVASDGAQDDAGSGGDAPEDWKDALDVTGTTFSGARTGPDDLVDWYRIQVPPGKSLRVTLTPETAHYSTLQALTDDGRNLSYSRYVHWNLPQTILVPHGQEAARIGARILDDEGGTYSITVRVLDPRPQHDGVYPEDASDDRDAALETPLGVHRGELRPMQGDAQDWYRVVVPPGMQVRAVLTLEEGDVWLMATDDGGWPDDVSGNTGPGGVEIVSVADWRNGGVRIGVRATSGEGYYTLAMHAHPLANLRVAALSIAPETSPIPQTSRNVTITINNDGGIADKVLLRTWATYYGAYSTNHDIGSKWLSIPANSSTNVTFSWETAGQAGNAYVHACISSHVDRTAGDNELVERTEVVAALPHGNGLHPLGYVPWQLEGLAPLQYGDYIAWCDVWD